jgi:hypothetical protein
MKIITKATSFATVLLATCFFAGAANAQVIKGTFTLQYSARWGQTVLPAGDYRLRFDPAAEPGLVVVTNAKNNKAVAFVSTRIAEDTTEGGSALIIGRRGNQRVIHSLRVAELAQVFISDPELAHGRRAEEAKNTETVPLLDAKK